MTTPAAPRLLFFVTEDWYFVSHRLPLAIAARNEGYDVAVLTRIRSHRRVIEASGLRPIDIAIHRSGMRIGRELLTLMRLIRIYRHERPDLVHHVAIKPVLYGSLAARLSGHPATINALAGMGWLMPAPGRHSLARWLTRYVLGRLMRRSFAIVQNADDARLLAAMGVRSECIQLIAGSGVNLRDYSPSPEPPSPVAVVLPARLLWSKGVGEFVDAARQLQLEGIVARFILAGEPDQQNRRAVPESRIRDWVAEGVVEHAGWVMDMPGLLAQCHVVCLPSEREGLPKALIEAAAAGKAIVTTDVPGCRDVVTHNESGLLVPAHDSQALAEALRRVITDQGLRARLGAAARRRAEIEFTDRRVFENTLALYRRALCKAQSQ